MSVSGRGNSRGLFETCSGHVSKGTKQTSNISGQNSRASG